MKLVPTYYHGSVVLAGTREGKEADVMDTPIGTMLRVRDG